MEYQCHAVAMDEILDAEQALIKPGRVRRNLQDRLADNTREIKPLVMAALKAGVPVSAITRHTKLTAATLIRWRKTEEK
jgi:hypothetical protein